MKCKNCSYCYESRLACSNEISLWFATRLGRNWVKLTAWLMLTWCTNQLLDLQQRRLCGKAPLVSVNCPATCRGAQNFITSFLWLPKKREENKRERNREEGRREGDGEISETSAANHKSFVACIFNTFFSVFSFLFLLWFVVFPRGGCDGGNLA